MSSDRIGTPTDGRYRAPDCVHTATSFESEKSLIKCCVCGEGQAGGSSIVRYLHPARRVSCWALAILRFRVAVHATASLIRGCN
jgi:hypothetical protein